MKVLIITALITIFSILTGMAESLLDKQIIRVSKLDAHIFIIAQRITFLSVIFLSMVFNFELIHILLIVIYSIFSYPYFHDGAFFWFKNVVDKSIFQKRWKAEGESTAIIEISYRSRFYFMVIGLFLIFISLFL